jgi:hydroxymethylglutaryl-CoA lyase
VPFAALGGSVDVFEKLPNKVTVYEVGPRDGLQNEAGFVPTDDKIRLIESLVAAGISAIEVTSFVSPKWIPPLADAEQVASRLTKKAGIRYSALVPNARGFERAAPVGLPEIAVFLSATETHTKKNTNRSIAEALTQSREVANLAHGKGQRVRGYLSAVWGCPYEGRVPIPQAVEIAARLVDAGVDEVSLGDTIGVGTPRQTKQILEAMFAVIPVSKIAMHMHDTRGTALANVIVGLEMGVTTFDSAVGGLGGCPYAPGAAGNLASEDLIYTLHEMGIETGIDLLKLVEAAVLAQTLVGRELPSKYFKAALGEAKRKKPDPTSGQT